jgi:hypothetical protein
MRKIAEIDLQIIESFLNVYTFVAFSEEFRDVNEIAKILEQSSGLSDPRTFIHQCYVEIITMAHKLSHSTAPSFESFGDFLRYAMVLSRCGFHRFLSEYNDDYLSRDEMDKYRRRLSKMARYHSGAIEICRAYRKYSGENIKISHIWLDSPAPIDVDIPPSALVAASKIFPTITTDKLLRANQNIVRHWATTVQTCVHAELRLICHLETRLPPRPLGLLLSRHRPQSRFIGLSRRSCLCCARWIQLWNSTYGTKWVTSSTEGMSFRT